MDKLTDAEIVMALECCIAKSGKGCSNCPYHHYYEECRTKRNNDCIDLINRQKAEIERLNAGQETLKKGIAEKDKEITRLQGIILAFMDEVAKLEDEGIDVSRFPLIPICDEGRNAIDKFSALAIKEFAKRFEDEMGEDFFEHYPFVLTALDNVAEEMTNQLTRIEHDSLCETETYKTRKG